MPPTIRSATLALVALAAACSSETNSGVRSDATVPRWHGTVDLVIGSLEGAHDQFGQPVGVAVDRGGRIFIADLQYNSIRAFDSTGRYLFDVAHAGSGPGELSGPCCLAFDGTGDLWVRDAMNGRFNRYRLSDSGAGFVEQRLMAPGVRGMVVPTTFDQAGRLIDVGLFSPGPGRSGVIRFHSDSTGVVLADTITGPPPDSLGERQLSARKDMIVIIQQPYGPSHLVGHAPGGGWASAVSSRYLVRWVVDGDTAKTQIVRRDMIGPALSIRERQSAESTLTEDASSIGQPSPFGVPGAKPPVAHLFFDHSGHLWVQLSVADGELNRADIYDSNGRRLAMAEWPGDIEIQDGYIGDRIAFGVREDSAGAPQVVRVRFH
jgi:hypothetical protein